LPYFNFLIRHKLHLWLLIFKPFGLLYQVAVKRFKVEFGRYLGIIVMFLAVASSNIPVSQPFTVY